MAQPNYGLAAITVKESLWSRSIASLDRCTDEAMRMGLGALHLWTESKDLAAYYAQRSWRRIGADEVDGEDVMVYDRGRADNNT